MCPKSKEKLLKKTKKAKGFKRQEGEAHTSMLHKAKSETALGEGGIETLHRRLKPEVRLEASPPRPPAPAPPTPSSCLVFLPMFSL